MKTSREGLALIKQFESCELEAYPDPGSDLGKECTRRRLPMREYRRVPNWQTLDAEPWTIAWGHTGKDVLPGMTVTQRTADELLEEDLVSFERAVESLVKVPITQGMFDSLVSFAYNCGPDIDSDDKAEGLGDSTLLKKVNAGDFSGAATEFLKWIRSGGVVMLGLCKRRAAERDLFMSVPIQRAG